MLSFSPFHLEDALSVMYFVLLARPIVFFPRCTPGNLLYNTMQSVICIALLYNLSKSANKTEKVFVYTNDFKCRLKVLVSVIVRRWGGREFHAELCERFLPFFFHFCGSALFSAGPTSTWPTLGWMFSFSSLATLTGDVITYRNVHQHNLIRYLSPGPPYVTTENSHPVLKSWQPWFLDDFKFPNFYKSHEVNTRYRMHHQLSLLSAYRLVSKTEA